MFPLFSDSLSQDSVACGGFGGSSFRSGHLPVVSFYSRRVEVQWAVFPFGCLWPCRHDSRDLSLICCVSIQCRFPIRLYSFWKASLALAPGVKLAVFRFSETASKEGVVQLVWSHALCRSSSMTLLVETDISQC
ncbi:hypothetical protein Bca4012_039581 [Brassica carinata]